MTKDELSEFASLMVDEIISRVRIQLDAGEGLSVADQRHMLEQLITERNRLAATRLEALQAQPVGEAIEHALGFVTQGMVIAYENGLRECGYDPVATLRAALTASPPVVEREAIEETGWLIEYGPSSPSAPRYWGGVRGWTYNHLEAVRFSRQVDAQSIAESMDDGVPGNYRLAEHMWSAAR